MHDVRACKSSIEPLSTMWQFFADISKADQIIQDVKNPLTKIHFESQNDNRSHGTCLPYLNWIIWLNYHFGSDRTIGARVIPNLGMHIFIDRQVLFGTKSYNLSRYALLQRFTYLRASVTFTVRGSPSGLQRGVEVWTEYTYVISLFQSFE